MAVRQNPGVQAYAQCRSFCPISNSKMVLIFCTYALSNIKDKEVYSYHNQMEILQKTGLPITHIMGDIRRSLVREYLLHQEKESLKYITSQSGLENSDSKCKCPFLPYSFIKSSFACFSPFSYISAKKVEVVSEVKILLKIEKLALLLLLMMVIMLLLQLLCRLLFSFDNYLNIFIGLNFCQTKTLEAK